MEYIPEHYWERRLTGRFNLSGVGCSAFSEYYNKWLYKAKIRALKRALIDSKLDTHGKKICDVGCGTGFFVDFYHTRNAGQIVGIDVTTISIESLRRKYPQYLFLKEDITSKTLNLSLKFDVLSVFDTLYHIVDDKAFMQAISNISNLTRTDGFIFVSDEYGPQDAKVASHVKFRGEESYQNVFQGNGIKVLAIYPLYNFLNRPILSRFLPIIGSKLDNWCAPIYYYLDRTFLSEERSSLKLIVAKKVKK